MRRVESRTVDANGLVAALDLLTPPFAAGVGVEAVPLVDGIVDVPRALRAPVVLVRLRSPLARRAVVVRSSPADGAVAGQPPAVFTAWSGAGSLLPLFTPELPAGAEGIGSLRLAVSVRTVEGSSSTDPAVAIAAASGPDLSAGEAADLVEALVVEGRLARLVHLLTAEKQRLTAVAREVAASRHVSLARSGALDAIGADHGVPRLAAEEDDAYRNRLLLFTSWWSATPARFEQALNGVPDGSVDGGPNTGLPSAVGITARFRIVEQAEQPAVTVRMVEVGPPVVGPGAWRQRFLDLAAGGLLLDLETAPSERLPESTRLRLDEARRVLTTHLLRAQPLDDRRYLGHLTATSLARAVLLLEALTGSGALTLRSAMTREADERLDLGLGVTTDPLAPDQVDRAVEAARSAQQAFARGEATGLPEVPPDVVGAALGARARDRADDPQATWLFTAAGLDATVLADGSLYLTSLPGHGLVIEGPARLAEGETGHYVARMRGIGSGRSVLVDEAWGRAAPGMAWAGAAAPSPLDPPATDELLASIAATAPAVPPAALPLVAAGLVPALPDEFVARVREAYDADLLLSVVLPSGLAGLTAEDPAAVAAREAIIADVSVLTAAGFPSVRVLPHPDGTNLVLLASVGLLPGGSNQPGAPVPAMYRWYVAPFPPPAPDRIPLPVGRRTLGLGDLVPDDIDWSFRLGGPRLRRPRCWTPAPLEVRRGLGGRADLVATRPGIALVVCVAYVRRGLADPYEVRLELPDGAVLDLDQYAYLMNLLEELCPLGIEMNTFDVRRNHVSPDGSPPQFLSGELSRSFTRYRRRRAVGPERHGPPGS